ncbi:hypothetical protein [Hallella sp.]|uniref:hypothetical protein n=1 Tax=Hallella sp. TaxID=2980186 RepID=UPI002A91D957|nr:hypothetical protein [Hallella sp.]MDY5924411.1 hypothetical protein [Hallella sp.]
MAQSLSKIHIRMNAFALPGRTNENTINTQGVASLALGYALVGLSARFYALMPLRGRISTHLTGRFCALMPFQPASELLPFRGRISTHFMDSFQLLSAFLWSLASIRILP